MSVVQCSSHVASNCANVDMDRCVCCLRNDVAFINLVSCKHGAFFGKIFHYKTSIPLKFICWQCHHMLVKVVDFKLKVEKSIVQLNIMLHQPICEPPKLYNLERTQTEIHYAVDSKPFEFENIKVKDELSNHSSGIWHKESTTSQNGGVSTTQQPLVDWTNDDAELPAQEELDLPVEIKLEREDSSDDEENVPLSQITVSSDLHVLTAKPSRSLKHKTLDDKFAGKVSVVTLSKEAYLLEKENERNKESFLKLPFRCDDCVVGFDHDVTLQEHMEKRHGNKKGSFVCKLCKSVLTTEYSFKEHNRRHFRRYECCECCKRYNTLNAAVEHYKEQHGAIVTAFTCEQCGFTTDSNRRYRYHRDKHKVKPQCSACGKTFVNNSGLKVHILTQHKESKHIYVCSVTECNKVFSAKSGLRAHLLSVHRSSTAYCTTCHTHFKGPSTLKHHLMTHSAHLSRTDWKFACDECGEKFLLKSALQEHIDWVHLRKTTYQCEQCSKVYKNARGLQRHKEFVHDKKRPPKDKICDHCGKGFTTLSILRTHIRTHTGERPLTCSRCPATFAHPAALYTHNKLIHAKTG